MADHSQRAQKIIERGQEMENVIAGMLSDFEAGKINRRQLIQSLALAAVAFHRQETVGAQTGVGFKTLSLDHISYQVADYRRTRDFYADLMGMTVADDNGSSQCVLDFGDSRLIARNRRQREGEAAPPDPKPTVDHICYTIEDCGHRPSQRRAGTPWTESSTRRRRQQSELCQLSRSRS